MASGKLCVPTALLFGSRADLVERLASRARDATTRVLVKGARAVRYGRGGGLVWQERAIKSTITTIKGP